jgi:uncharacterized delta-60 repeat protein
MIASRKALIVVAAFVLMALGLPWGGSVPAAFAQAVSVTAADPPTGEQGTLNLSVLIKGKGFKNGAKAKWFKTGTTDPAGVNVKSTQFVSSTQLIATIDIADAAALSLFDIQVQNTDGRTGKGTGLFSVTTKAIDPCTLPDPEPSFSANVIGPPGLPGYFDAGLGNGTGKVVGPRFMQTGYDRGTPVAIDNLGRIVAVGIRYNTCATSTSFEWAIARYLPNGSLDVNFGAGGMVTIAFSGGARAQGVAIQPDGKIVVAGSAKPSRSSNALPVVVRLTGTGSLDSTFDGDGVSWVSPGGKSPSGGFYSAVVQSDGKIVAAGYTNGVGFVSRLHPNGALDSAFNGSGKYVLGVEALFHTVRTQVIGSQERIVIAGAARDASNHWIGAVWRFTGSGAPDSSFGTGGLVTTSFHDETAGYIFEDEFRGLAIDAANRIVTAGYALTHQQPTSEHSSQAQVVVARYAENGSLDVAFGDQGNGTVRVPATQAYEIGRAIAVQADGLLLVGGNSHAYGATGSVNYLVTLWRFTADGLVDTGFGPGGLVSDPITSGTRAAHLAGLALQPDGNIVTVGYVIMESDPIIPLAFLARFWQ